MKIKIKIYNVTTIFLFVTILALQNFAQLQVIASNIDGPREILKDGKYGYIYESENIDQLSQQILNALSNDNVELVKDAYFYSVKNYSINSMIGKLQEVYAEL